MDNNFSDKVKNFAEWSKTAFEHFNNRYYADALTNMRKCGESACKIMILHKFSGKISENKIGQKNYKELIEVIIKDNLAPRKVINWLETLQIHGNEATHDTRIMQEQSYYGIIALRLLIYWLYIEFLKSTVPTGLQNEISQIKEKSVDLIKSKKVEEERGKLINEKEELEKTLNLLKGKENQENEKITNLTIELNNSVTKIKELDTAQQKIINLEKELSRYKIETEELKSKQNITEILKKKNYFKIIAVSALSVIVIIVGIFVFKNIRTHFDNVANEKANAETIKQQADSFKVLVFPFAVFQDNPNVKINIEDAIVNDIRQKSQDLKLPLIIIYKPSPNISVLSKNDLIKEGKKEKAFMVLTGDLYEPISNNDSVQVNIKSVLLKDNNSWFEESGLKSFYKISDSSAIRIIHEVECNINFTIAENYVHEKKKYSEALALLYKSIPVTNTQRGYYCNFIAECQVAMKNFNAAIIELEKYIRLEPANAYPYAFLANVYKRKKDYDKAETYYKKSLQIEPNNVNTLQNYSSLLLEKDSKSEKNKIKARLLLQEAIRLDSMNAIGLFSIAEVEKMMRDYQAAKKHYIKSIKVNPDYTEAKVNLASMLAFELGDPESALKYINNVLAKDSNEVRALFLLANIYTNTKIKNPVKAEYLFKKSKSLTKGNNLFDINMGLGYAALEKRNDKAALDYFLKAYSIKNTDPLLCTYIAQTYMKLNDNINIEKYLMRARELDSLSGIVNFNLGYFYFMAQGNYNNQKKATYYFNKVLETNPYDTLSLQWLGTIYANQKNIPEMRNICAKLNSISPNSFFSHKLSGYVAEFDEDIFKALFHYKKSLEFDSNDDECNYKVAFYLLQKTPEKHLKEALKYAGEALAINPLKANHQYIYGKVLVLSGDFKNGILYYKKAKEIDHSIYDEEIELELKKTGL